MSDRPGREVGERPEIELTADVRMRSLRFEEVPDPEVRFPSNRERRTEWRTERENLPENVRPGVTYRKSSVNLRIATELEKRGLGGPFGDGAGE